MITDLMMWTEMVTETSAIFNKLTRLIALECFINVSSRGFDSRWGTGIFFFSTASRPALKPTQTPIQCVVETFSTGVKRPGREADHSTLSNADVKNAWRYTSTQHVFMSWCLVKHRDNFTFTFAAKALHHTSRCHLILLFMITTCVTDLFKPFGNSVCELQTERGEVKRVYSNVFGLADWNENCKWYSSLPLGAVLSLFCESV
jgi:hypothetical protein